MQQSQIRAAYRPGQGLAVNVLRWRGHKVTTYDIDPNFNPDHIGSVHDLKIFSPGQFDVVVASHVLGYLPPEYLDIALKEISRVGHYAIIYLPVAGRHLQLRFVPGFTSLDFSCILDFFNYFKRPDGITPQYTGNQHFWK